MAIANPAQPGKLWPMIQSPPQVPRSYALFFVLLTASCLVALAYGATIALSEHDLRECLEIADGKTGLRVAEMSWVEKFGALSALGMKEQLGAGVVLAALMPFLAATWFSNVPAARLVFGIVGMLCLAGVVFFISRPITIWHGCDANGTRTLVFALVLVPVASTLFFACLAITAFFKTPFEQPME